MEIRFTRHCLERLFQRAISPKDCETVFTQGIVIESYPDDKPFPSELRLGSVNGKFLHIVVSFDNNTAHVITAYEPDPRLWEDGLRKRRPK